MKEVAFSSSDKQENIGMCAVMALIPILFFLPLVVNDKKYSPYCMHRANQTLLVLIIGALVGIATGILSIFAGIPLIGLIFRLVIGLLGLVSGLFYLNNLVLAILGSGKGIFLFGEIEILK